jgi:RNA polymerase sigma factor (sigma-70 family)
MATASKTGDERNALLDILYRLHQHSILRFLTGKVGQNDAPDLLQETFAKISRSETNIDNIINNKAFLLQVASNLAVDHSRKTRRYNRLLSRNEVDALLTVPDETARPDHAAQARIEGQLLARAIAEMPLRRAEVFRLNRLDGLSHQVIATRLGVSVRTVEAEICMALDHCAERLGRIRPKR